MQTPCLGHPSARGLGWALGALLLKFFTNSACSILAVTAFSVEFAAADVPVGSSLGAEESRSTENEDSAEGRSSERGSDVSRAESLSDLSVVTDGVSGEEVESEKTLNRCISHHEKAQLARLSGGFLEALRELSACAASECPQALRNDCLNWRGELAALTPTIIVVAEDDEGDIENARVFVDGSVVRERLDGRPFHLNPGTHVIRVELPNGERKERRVVVAEGEKSRRVSFTFRTPPAEVAPAGAPPTKTIRPIPPGVFLLGGSAFVGLGVAIGFGSDAYSKARRARDLCAPLCDADVSRAVTERAAIADVALGIAVASTIGAVVVYSYRPERVVPVDGVSVDFVPDPRGGSFTVKGAFR